MTKGNKRLVEVRDQVNVPEGGNMTFKVAERQREQEDPLHGEGVRDGHLAEGVVKSNTQKLR